MVSRHVVGVCSLASPPPPSLIYIAPLLKHSSSSYLPFTMCIVPLLTSRLRLFVTFFFFFFFSLLGRAGGEEGGEGVRAVVVVVVYV